MPGMGLTGVGLAGLILSYAGIAHTFIDGMHALTGLTMFVGLIFTAAGILDGGISTSNRAKITTLVIVAISLGFGLYALGTMNTSDFTLTVVLILLAAYMDVTAVITKRTTILGLDISIISLIPNLLYPVTKWFYSLL